MSPSDHDIPSTHLSLLDGTHGREAEAWGLFFLRYRPVVLRWCKQRGLRDHTAEDIAQMLMAEIPRKLDSYHPEGRSGKPQPFRSWLKTVVGNLVCDYQRAQGRKPGDFGEGGDEHMDALALLTAGDTEGMAEDITAEYRADLQRVIEAVQLRLRGKDTWAIYQSLVLDDRPAAEVAERFDKTIGAVHVAAHAVKKKLAEEYRTLFTNSGTAGQGGST